VRLSYGEISHEGDCPKRQVRKEAKVKAPKEVKRQIKPLAENESYLVGKIEKAVPCGYFSMPNKKRLKEA
jgi:hypothetical protein